MFDAGECLARQGSEQGYLLLGKGEADSGGNDNREGSLD